MRKRLQAYQLVGDHQSWADEWLELLAAGWMTSHWRSKARTPSCAWSGARSRTGISRAATTDVNCQARTAMQERRRQPGYATKGMSESPGLCQLGTHFGSIIRLLHLQYLISYVIYTTNELEYYTILAFLVLLSPLSICFRHWLLKPECSRQPNYS